MVGYPQSRTDNSHFAIIHDTYMEQEISYAPYMESIVNDSESWDDYLFTPTYEEQAEMLAKVFPREALEFAWQEFPEYMRTIPRNTVSVSMLDETDDSEEDSAESTAAAAPRRPVIAQNVSTTSRVAKPSGVAEAQAVAAEISADAAESVAGLFNAAEIPAAMTPSAVVPPAAKKQSPTLNANDVLARARAKAK